MPRGDTSPSNSCRVCGGPIRADTTDGHCPACLLDRLVNLAPEPAIAAPSDLADYELEEIIGRGGMGVVWRARQRKLDRVVAVKFLAGGEWASEEARGRLRAEAQAAARLRHPGIVPVIDVGESENGPWLSMEFVPGQTLAERLARGSLAPREAAELLRAVSEAVAHAHQHGVLHRDLKPGNILLDAAGQPRVADFGLARVAGTDASLTRTGQLVGSPAYLAPENLSHAAPSAAGDIYALGATLYHALTGRPPFAAPTVEGVLRQVADAEPASPRQGQPNIPADLETIALTCLQKLPTRRYATAALLAEDLRRFLDGRPIAARPVAAWEKAWRWCQRRPAVATLLALLALGTAAAFWRIDTSRQAERRERARAEASLADLQAKTTALQIAETNLTASNVRLAESLEHTQLARTEDLFEQDRYAEGLLALARLLRAEPPSRLAAGRLMGLLLHQNVARLAEVPTFFFQKMTHVVHAPDGRHGFAGGDGGRLWRLRLDGGKMQHEAIEGAFHRDTMSLSGDGSTFAVARRESAGPVAVIDVVTGEVSPHAFDHGAPVTAIRVSRDGQRLATGGRNGVARVWDRASGQPIGAPLKHGAPIQFLSLTPDGQRLVTAGEDGVLLWWEAGRSNALARQRAASGPFTAFAASADGSELATGHPDGTVMLWDATAARRRETSIALRDQVCALAFSPDGRGLACGTTDGRVRLVRLPEGTALAEDLQSPAQAREFAFSADSRRLVVCSDSATVVLLDARTGRRELQSLNHVERAPSAAFLPRGEKLLTASAEGTLRTWDLRPSRARELILTEPGPSPALAGGALAPSGRHALTWSAGGVLRRWPLASLETAAEKVPAPLFAGSARIRFAVFSPEESRVLAGFEEGVCRVFALTNEPMTPLTLPHRDVPTCGAFSPDGEWIATGGNRGEVLLWRARDGAPGPKAFSHKMGVGTIAFSPDGQWLATASGDHSARFWQWRDTNATPIVVRHEDLISSATFSPDGRLVGTASDDNTAALWDVATGERRFTLRHGRVSKVIFSPDGERVATARKSESVQFWDARTGKATSRIAGHRSAVLNAVFSPDGHRFATASQDGTARVWDVASGLPLTPPLRHEAGVCAVAFFPDGLRLFTASKDGTARIWDAPVVPESVPAWAARLPRILAGVLTEEEKQNPLTALDLWQRTEAELRAITGNDALSRVARWFGAPATERARSPFSPGR